MRSDETTTGRRRHEGTTFIRRLRASASSSLPRHPFWVRLALPGLLLVVIAGCASSEAYEARAPRLAPRSLAGAMVGGTPVRSFFERRAALLVAGATVTASHLGISVHAPAGGAAAAVARDGYLLTAARCIDGNGVHVYLYGDETWYAPARVVRTGDRKRSPLLDLAIVKIDVPLPGALEWATPAEVTESADLVSFGFRRTLGPEGEPGQVGLDLGSGHALAEMTPSLPSESGPRISTLLHDIAALEEEGGAAVATRSGRLIGIHIGTIDGPGGERTGVAVQPDPVWIARRIAEDRKSAKHR